MNGIFTLKDFEDACREELGKKKPMIILGTEKFHEELLIALDERMKELLKCEKPFAQKAKK